MLGGINKFLWVVFAILPMMATAQVTSLDEALRATYTACVGIDDSLADLKKMAGINTAVTGVGTGLGIGATAVGITKANIDQQIDEETQNLRALSYAASPHEEVAEEDVFENEVMVALSKNVSQSGHPVKARIDRERADRKMVQKSKSLGKWRIGLLAGNTATNVAGAVVASKNKTDGDLEKQIEACKTAVYELRRMRTVARLDGADVSEASNIISACEDFERVDTAKINNRAKGAMISSIVGAATGFTGTITSAVANSDNVRMQKNADGTQTDKERNLNATSNVLAGASTVASGVATLFNATQIKAIKEVANVAAKCTEALK